MSKRKRVCEWAKDLLIVLLLCSAAWLLIDSRLFGDLSRETEQKQTGTTQQTPAPTAGQVTLPMGVAVTNTDGVCAARYDAAAVNELFQPLLPVLGEAMAGAGQAEPVEPARWREGLSAPGSVWLELQGNVPMQVLCRWLGGVSNPNLTGSARQLLLCVEQEQVRLYYYLDDQTCYSCAVEGVSADYLRSVLAQAVPNGALFAAADRNYDMLAPQTLILGHTPVPEEYTAVNPLAGGQELDALLQALSFSPGITTIYQTPEGQRARSGNDTLTISNDGLLNYERAEEEQQRYPLAGSEGEPEEYRAVETARKLVSGVTEPWGGTAIYLRDVWQEADGWHVEFGYVLNTIPVLVGDRGWCAQVVVDELGAAQYEICLRSYQPTGKTTLLLPQPQAAAALEQMGQAGSGLLLSYLDSGDSVQAGWMAEE